MNEGERIRKIRIALKITLEEFGSKVGVIKVAMSIIEKENCNVTEQMQKAICREFNVNYDYLMYSEEDMFSNLPQTVLDELCRQYGCDDDDRIMIEEYLKMNADSRKVLKDYILKCYSEMKKGMLWWILVLHLSYKARLQGQYVPCCTHGIVFILRLRKENL